MNTFSFKTRLLLFAALAAFAAGAALFLPASAHAAWYDANYDYCRELTMTAGGNSGGVATTSTKGFALVATSTMTELKSIGNGGHIQLTQTDAHGTTTPKDVIITNGTECNSDGGSAILDFYFEKYVETTGEFVLWVESQDISSTSAKTVLMYYGNASATDQSDEAGVFNGTAGTGSPLREIAVWSLSEDPTAAGAGGILDSTSNNNDGTDSGSMATANQINGVVGGGFDFNGTGNEIDMPDIDATEGLSNFSISLWINRDVDVQEPGIVTKFGATDGWGLMTGEFVNSSCGGTSGYDDLAFVADPSNDCGGTSNHSLSTGSWQHWVMTFNQNAAANAWMAFYKNGVSQPEDYGTTQDLPTDSNAQHVTIGGYASGVTGNNFNGKLDDIRLFALTLHSMDALTIYNNTRSSSVFWTFGAEETEPVPPSSISKPPNNLGLVGYWPMNEATSTIAGDFSGRGNHGSFPGGSANPSWANGKRGAALSFDGSADYVPVGVSGFPAENANQTLSAWVYYTSAPGSAQNVVGRYGSSSGHGFGFHDLAGCSGSGYRMGVWTWGGLIFLCSPTLPAIGVWHLMTYTWDGTTHRFYVDGVEVDNDTTAPTTNATTVTEIGSFWNGGSRSEYFAGKIDEVRLYTRVLGPAEVLSLYQSGAARLISSSKNLTQGTTLGPSNGLVGHWTFDGGDMNWTGASAGVAYDGSGNNNIGTLTSMSRSSAVVIGKLGQAIYLASDAEVSVPNSTSINLGTTETIAFWIKGTAASGFGRLIQKADQSTTGFIIQNTDTNGNKDLYVRVDTSGGVNQNCTGYPGLVGVLDGEWHHVVVVIDNGTCTVYKDAVAGTGGTYTVGAGFANSGVPFRLIDDDPNITNVSYDEVRVYNRALSAAEVKQLYRLGQAVIKQ